jgi:hemolysin III
MEKIILAKDGCAINAETDYGTFPVEPLNAVSNLVFIVIIFHIVKKVGFRFGKYPLIVTVLPVIALGVLSSIMHHLFRAEKVWNSVNMLAILYSVIMTCVYLWYRISGRWMYAFLYTMMMPFIFWLFYPLSGGVEKLTVSIIFIAFSITIIIPSMIYCMKTELKHLNLVALSSFLFSIAMTFRAMDFKLSTYFAHGSHFLWHIVGAAALFVFFRYIYLIDEERGDRDLEKKK